MLKRSRKIISVAVVLSLIVAMETGLAGKPAKAAADYGISNPVMDSNGVATWDKVKFGSYYQTAEFKPEPIKWRVLSVNGDDVFLLADQCLDSRQFTEFDKTAEGYTSATWETCSLRKWLNDDFYNEAFSDSEKAAIRETVVNNQYGEVVKNDTMDRIYLLSVDEVCNEDYGFESDDSFTKTRRAQNTDYAKCNNAENSPNGLGSWRLRSPATQCIAAFVDESGHMNSYGISSGWYAGVTFDPGRAVRPVLHLNLSSSSWSISNKVSSDGTEKPVPGETPSADGSPKLDASTGQPVKNISSPVPAKPGTVSIKSAKNSKKGVAVLTWKKVNGASGYQIQYALDRKFAKSRKTKTIVKARCTLKKLKKKKTYFFRICAYKKTGSKNVYGAWSKVKKVKIKK